MNRQQKYDAANTTQLHLKLNRKTDADILAKLDSIGNKQGYIKSLIRKEIPSMTLYKVETTFLGADGPSYFYFDSEQKAKAYLASCNNGDWNVVKVRGDEPNYSDGCTYNDLTMGGQINLVETEI